LEVSGSNSEILEKAKKAAKAGEREAVIKRKVSAILLAQLLNVLDLRRIYCSRSMLACMPKNAADALKKVGVEIVVGEARRGRPRAHGEEKIKSIAEMKAKGAGAERIAKALGLPLRTVYYYLQKKKKKANV